MPGDAAATAASILAHETLFRFGFSLELLHLACDVASAAILAVASGAHFAALRLLSGADYLAVLPADETQALALVELRHHADGYGICLVFFAFACGALGWLILRSGFVPRAIGTLLVIAGACYLVYSLASFVAPAAAAQLFPAIVVPAAIAELSLALWLLLQGIDEAKWRSLQGA